MSRPPHPDSEPEAVDFDATELDFATMEANLSAMEDHLFNAGVAILHAAKTQEDVFQTSMEAIQEALDAGSGETQGAHSLPSAAPPDISLTTIWQRLDQIEHRLEYLIQHLIPASPRVPAKAATKTPPAAADLAPATELEWTEKSLKKAYKTLAATRSQLGIEAKTWKLAVAEANALRQANLA